MKRAFTLIELIFVIVILSIISMFGADLYQKIYRSYVHTRATNDLEAKTEITLNFIASKLQDRIRPTQIGRKGMDGAEFVPLFGELTEEHDTLEWLGQSIETKYVGGKDLGWSGFADINSAVITTAPDKFKFTSPGSDLSKANAILTSLNAGSSFGIIFQDSLQIEDVTELFGFNGKDHTLVGKAEVKGNEIEVSGLTGLTNKYSLSHSAYAIYPGEVNKTYVTGENSTDFDLYLCYGYKPWEGETCKKNGKKQLIAEHVSMFRFQDAAGSIAIKLCMRDAGKNFDKDELDFIVCKSQVVF